MRWGAAAEGKQRLVLQLGPDPALPEIRLRRGTSESLLHTPAARDRGNKPAAAAQA